MQQSFDFAALKFLMLWERVEKPLHAAFSSKPSAADVRRALRHFQVSRTFSGVKEAARAELIFTLVEQATSLHSSPVERVEYLADQFKVEFETRNVSAASKLLWLRHRAPHIILDSRAFDAIAAVSDLVGKSNFGAYADAWRLRYGLVNKTVENACTRHLDAKAQIARWRDDSVPLEQLVTEPWFRERVFDIHLWEFNSAG